MTDQKVADGMSDAILDMDMIRTLQALQREGAPNVLDRIIAAYLRSSHGLMEQVSFALSDGDLDTIRDAAHSLKSGSANVGAVMFSETAKSAEFAARAGDMEQAAIAVRSLAVQWPALVDALTTLTSAETETPANALTA